MPSTATRSNTPNRRRAARPGAAEDGGSRPRTIPGNSGGIQSLRPAAGVSSRIAGNDSYRRAQLAVQPRRPAGDGSNKHRTARADHPPARPERPQPLVAGAQRVERPQQQHGIHGAVAEVQVAGVADRGVDPIGVGDRAELLDVERHEVAVLDPVATPSASHSA
jgi:hypothetical protein